jgi:prepilin-type N-terminal cleavage/methylation domain-containing protein
MRKVRKQSGFTLVELLIVAIILAILAAIVVPQFASTTDDARDSALRANLASIRGAIDLYRQQHNQNAAFSASTGGTCTGGTGGSGAVRTQAALEEQLTRYTNATGQSCSLTVSGSFRFGPYVKEDAMPANPITGSNVVAIVNSGNLEMSGDGAGLGWKYDVLTGKFIANDTSTDGGGLAYDTY